jgi:putative transposase
LAPNLLGRRFAASAPDRVSLADITYIPTADGWLYLAVVLDMFSRRVVGWAMDVRITQELTVNALRMAIATRRPLPGLLHHSDRGGNQCAAHAYRGLLASHGMCCSMSQKADCWGNAPKESFFGSMKTELDASGYQTRQAARSELFQFIEGFHNCHRLQLGNRLHDASAKGTTRSGRVDRNRYPPKRGKVKHA